ncbi:MAG: 2Fe-2S iron-sulfur cluster binding domain-containing protein [Alphaproteobacteria bacterium]|nr:2Fe-2S iron-sulfur cluster binding domain-containing protein [Alphaproteobacteria bacterium]
MTGAQRADVPSAAGSRRADWLTRLRLGSGIVLFVYQATHLVNHALGLISLAAMEAGREFFLVVWRNPAATVLLYGSLALHAGLVLYTLYRRRTLRLPRAEALQIIGGLAIPPLFVVHAVPNRLAHELFGITDTYGYVIVATWLQTPLFGVLMVLLLVIAWMHGCLGVHYWLKIKPWYPPWAPLLGGLAVLWPAAALAGYVAGAREVAIRIDDPAWAEELFAAMTLPAQAEAAAAIYGVIERTEYAMAALLALILALRWIRVVIEQRRQLVTIRYPSGQRVAVQPGMTVLEASRSAGIPHASVCGGRGRCSTCRVRVGSGGEHLPPASEDELRVLQRVGAAANVRLACQIRPQRDLAVTPLLAPTAQPHDARARPAHVSGSEREIAILFADMRAFTAFSEHRLPYDVVFVLNQYFRAMGRPIEDAGGHLDKFIGDGVMALFGIERGVAQGCRDALTAAREMARAINELNATLKDDLPAPLRIGIGIHTGAVIVGEMGYARASSITAIGDAVNTASRLESANKEFHSQLVVSAEVAARAGVDLGAFPQHDIAIRGRSEPMQVYVIEDASGLPEIAARAAA